MPIRAEGAILDLDIAVPRYFITHDNLAAARGVEPEKYRAGLGCWEMSVCGPGEDVVTLAAGAAWRLLRRHPHLREKIGLCVVGTESGVDGAKPTAIYVHQLVDLPSTCRVFEIKHACYGATAALQMAQAWTCMRPDRYALVIAADVARYKRYSAGEPTQGAGAVAMLVGQADGQDVCMTLSAESGSHAQEVYDFWRPNYQASALVKGKFSVECYLNSLTAAHDDFQRQSKESLVYDFDYLLYHVPFPQMARKAHAHLLGHLGMKDEEAVLADYHRRVKLSLWANRRVGNVYSASLYLALAGLWERESHAWSKKTMALFSYGSGSCSEYFAAVGGTRSPAYQLKALLDQRVEVDVSTYEALSDRSLLLEQNDSIHSEIVQSTVPFAFLGIRDHERVYEVQVACEQKIEPHDMPESLELVVSPASLGMQMDMIPLAACRQ